VILGPTDIIVLLFSNVFTMANLGNKDKMCIHGLHEQGFGAKAKRASYPGKNWRLNTLKMICHGVDKTGSAVTRRAGRVGCCSWIWDHMAIVSFRSRL